MSAGVDRENSLAMWWSSLMLGVMTWVMYRQRGARGRVDRIAWYGLVGGFLFL